MKNKDTFATYFKQNWWPMIKQQAKELFIPLLIVTTSLTIIATLYYFHNYNRPNFYSIILILIMFIITYPLL